MVTPIDIVNQAIQYIGDNQPPVTGNAPNFDSSPAGIAAAALYLPCVQTVARQFEWDFARFTATLVLSNNPAPLPWKYEYLYPADAVQVWQVMPPTVDDLNNPLPTRWVVANSVVQVNVGGVVTAIQKRVIHTNIQFAKAVYNNVPNENAWDATFREAVARLLASEIAMAIAARPDTSQNLLESGSAFERIGEGRNS